MGSVTIVHEADMTDQRRNSPSGRARYRPRRVGMHLPVNAYHVNESGCERRSRRSNEGFCYTARAACRFDDDPPGLSSRLCE